MSFSLTPRTSAIAHFGHIQKPDFLWTASRPNIKTTFASRESSPDFECDPADWDNIFSRSDRDSLAPPTYEEDHEADWTPLTEIRTNATPDRPVQGSSGTLNNPVRGYDRDSPFSPPHSSPSCSVSSPISPTPGYISTPTSSPLSFHTPTRQRILRVPVRRKTCTICIEERPSSEFPTVPMCVNCGPDTTGVCRPCIQQHIVTQLANQGERALRCICGGTLTAHDVQRNATHEDFLRYCERATLGLVERDPRFVWCPAPGCGGGQLHERGDAEPIVTCFQCRRRSCFRHRVPWHAGVTCRDFDRLQSGEAPEAVGMPSRRSEAAAAPEEEEQRLARAWELETRRHSQHAQAKQAEQARKATEARQREAEERTSNSYVQRAFKQCPNCRARTEKDGGCKHVTCKLFSEFFSAPLGPS